MQFLELEKKRENRRKLLEYAATVPTPPKPTKQKVELGLSNDIKHDTSDLELNNLLTRHRAEQARVHRLKALADIK